LHINVLLKNQGVYNALAAVLILISVFGFSSPAAAILMGYIVPAALYGAVSSNPKILLQQGGLAIVTPVSCLIQIF
jgi:putative membrane protein